MNATFDATALMNLAIAVLAGLAVGIERQWSGHADGPRAHFAGLRTFTLLGLVSGLSGWLLTVGLTGIAVVFLAGLGGLVVAAYYAASRRDVDGTTEVAAFVVLATGVLAGAGHERLASATTALTLILLVEKRQLHRLVTKLDMVEMRAAARFAVMAAVILPLLPEGPYGPLGGVRPRLLWALVLFFSGLSFVGYFARRIVRGGHGYAVAGTLGGIISSTSVTLALARLSRERPELGPSLAAGVMGASAVLVPRVLVATLVLEPRLAAALWPALAAPFVLGGVLAWRDARRSRQAASSLAVERNPLHFRAALQMALLFQLVLFAVAFATRAFGQAGLYGTAAILGLTDVDALTLSMARLTSAGTASAVAAEAITIGILANTIVKCGIALSIGRGRFRPLAATGLALTAATLVGAVILLRVW